MEKINFLQAVEAKEILLQFLKEEGYEGYDGEDTFTRYSDKYLAIIVLNQLFN